MKKYLPLILAGTLLLNACSVSSIMPSWGKSKGRTTQTTAAYQLDSQHWSDVAKLRAEAQRLGTQVQNGKITKVQAALMLNQFRKQHIGSNSVDDNVYEVYQEAAVASQSGKISAEQSKAYIKNALMGWQQRWPYMSNKPKNPAFTNFLLEYMGMQPLQ